jgi:MarR family transcriptional regulator, organic hydroperoxide resistance regulator
VENNTNTGHTASEAHVLRLEQQLCFSVYTFSRKIAKLYRPYLDRLHITYPQYLVVLILGECGTCTVTELGDKLFLDSGTLTPLLKRMQEAGTVSRMRSVEDERKVIVSLTEGGCLLWQELKDIHSELSKQIHVPLDEYTRTLDEFHKLTNRISQIWSGE